MSGVGGVLVVCRDVTSDVVAATASPFGCKVTGVDSSGAVLNAKVEPAKGGAAETIEADVVLVATGRVPYTEGLGLDEVGVQKDNRGRVIVDAHYATSVKGIYAIGDVDRRPDAGAQGRGRGHGGRGNPSPARPGT